MIITLYTDSASLILSHKVYERTLKVNEKQNSARRHPTKIRKNSICGLRDMQEDVFNEAQKCLLSDSAAGFGKAPPAGWIEKTQINEQVREFYWRWHSSNTVTRTKSDHGTECGGVCLLRQRTPENAKPEEMCRCCVRLNKCNQTNGIKVISDLTADLQTALKFSQYSIYRQLLSCPKCPSSLPSRVLYLPQTFWIEIFKCPPPPVELLITFNLAMIWLSEHPDDH